MLGALTIRSITSLIVALVLQLGMVSAVQEEPQDAAELFMQGISQQQSETMNENMGNDYVNFIANVEGDRKTTDRLRENLFKNFSYKITGVEERGNLAVAREEIKGNDFSKAMKNYEKESYDYVTGNLYDDDVVDEKALKRKCLEIYVDQIEKEAKKGKLRTDTVFLPMEKDGYGLWQIMISDDIMKQILGNIALPKEVFKKQ